MEDTPRSVFGSLALLCLWVGSILMLFASSNTHWRIVEHNKETAKTIHEGLWYRCVSFLGTALLDFQCTEIRNVLISNSMKDLRVANPAIQWISYVRFLVFLAIVLHILTSTFASFLVINKIKRKIQFVLFSTLALIKMVVITCLVFLYTRYIFYRKDKHLEDKNIKNQSKNQPGIGYGFFMVGGSVLLDLTAYLFMCLSFKDCGSYIDGSNGIGKGGYSRRIISPSSLPDRFDTIEKEAPDPYKFHRSYGDLFNMNTGANL